MIRIEIVRLADGSLIGRSFSDRWNLETLRLIGLDKSTQLDISQVLTKGQVDRLRRTLKGMGFTLSLNSKAEPLFHMSDHELSAIARPFSSLAARVRRVMKAS